MGETLLMGTNETLKNRFKIVSLLLVIIGLVIIIFKEMYVTNSLWGEILNNVAVALFIGGIFELMNEFYLKDKLVEVILEKLKLKENIDKTGITDVFSDTNDIDYRFYIKNSNKNIDIYHVYGRSWTNSNLDSIRDKLLRSNCNIRVILLSPNSKFIEGLAERYEITGIELKANIKEMEKTWRKLFEEKNAIKKRRTQSSLKFFYSDSFPVYSLYKFDDNVVSVQSKPSKGRTTSLPIIVCKDTNKGHDLHDMYIKEIEDIISQSIEVDLS